MPVPSGKKPKATSSNQTNTGPKKTDYVAKAKSNEQIGKVGEEFAVKFEHWRLKQFPALREKVCQVSNTDDSLGYDIESFEPDGSARFVEVKSTTGSPQSDFFITANEIEVAENLGGRYVILRVTGLPDNPKCFQLRYPYDAHLDLVPEIYVAKLKSAQG